MVWPLKRDCSKLVFLLFIAVMAVFCLLASKNALAYVCYYADKTQCVNADPDLGCPVGYLMINDPSCGQDCTTANMSPNLFKTWCGQGGAAQHVPVVPQPQTSQGEGNAEKPFTPTIPQLEVQIPGFQGFSKDIQICLEEGKSLEECQKGQRGLSIPWLGEYIIALYKWALRAIAILAIFMVMLAGVQWILAGGNPAQISAAKSKISSALIGVVLILTVNLILSVINPQLTIFKPIILGQIEKIELTLRSGSIGVGSAGQGTVKEYNGLPCPTEQEKEAGFEGFITAYYSMAYGSKGSAKTFECNVAIECGCPGIGRTEEICVPGVKSCKPITQEQFRGMCKGTPTGKTLQDFSSAAADVNYSANKWGQKCFKFGEKFEISGSTHPELNKVWTIDDVGSYIQGRHFDLYVGADASLSSTLSEKVTIKFIK